MMRNNEYLDIHVLETVPPSCVNRDDTGSPKTAVYGGAVRARVSSQCWKKAVRDMFQDMLPQDAYRWQIIEENMRRICAEAAHREIRTPVF